MRRASSASLSADGRIARDRLLGDAQLLARTKEEECARLQRQLDDWHARFVADHHREPADDELSTLAPLYASMEEREGERAAAQTSLRALSEVLAGTADESRPRTSSPRASLGSSAALGAVTAARDEAELDNLRLQGLVHEGSARVEALQQAHAALVMQRDAQMRGLEGEAASLVAQLKESQARSDALRADVLQLRQSRLDGLPIDVAGELSALQVHMMWEGQSAAPRAWIWGDDVFQSDTFSLISSSRP